MAKQRIELRGVIVDAGYDDEFWFDNFITKGFITPESRIRAALKEAAAAQNEVELYISSGGGCVASGYEILAAFHEYPHAKTITVGSIAASMAANITLQSGAKVKAHKNTIFLFHSAYSCTVGGSEAHNDTAKFLNQINGEIKAVLLAKGVPPDVVKDGFAEGRILTMTAAEAKQYGIVDEIFGEDAPPVARLAKEDEAAIAAKGSTVDIAAFSQALDSINHNKENKMAKKPKGKAAGANSEETTEEETTTEETTTEETTEEETTTEEEETTEEPAAADESEEENEEVPEESGAAKAKLVRVLALLSAKAAAYNAAMKKLKASHKTALAAKNKKLADLQAEYDSFTVTAKANEKQSAQKIETLKAEVSRITALHAAVTGGALSSKAAKSEAITDWPAAVSKFGVVDALKKYPELAKAYRESKNK